MNTTPIDTTDPRAAAEIVNARLVVDPCSAEVNSLEWSAHVGDLMDDSDIVEPEDVVGGDGVQINNDSNDNWRTDFWLHLQDITLRNYQ